MLSSKNCENSIFTGISDLTDIAAEEKQKIVSLKAIGQDMTCLEAGHRLFLSLGPSGIVMSGHDKRVAPVAGTQ